MGKKHHRLSLKEKVSVIRMRERDNLSVRMLFERFEVSRSQIKDILRNKESILKSWNTMDNSALIFRSPKTGLNFSSEIVCDYVHPLSIRSEDNSLRENLDQCYSLLRKNQTNERSTSNIIQQKISPDICNLSKEEYLQVPRSQRNNLQQISEAIPHLSDEEYPQRDE